MLAQTLLKRRKEYYIELGKASKRLDIDDWLLWFSAICIEAQRNTLSYVDFIIEKDKLFSLIQNQINTRQAKVLLRLFKAGPEGFKGGLSADNYKRISGASTPTATRDLRGMVEKGALRKEGERKVTRYYLSVNYTPIQTVTIDDLLAL